jgi:hypothetical protein
MAHNIISTYLHIYLRTSLFFTRRFPHSLPDHPTDPHRSPDKIDFDSLYVPPPSHLLFFSNSLSSSRKFTRMPFSSCVSCYVRRFRHFAAFCGTFASEKEPELFSVPTKIVILIDNLKLIVSIKIDGREVWGGPQSPSTVKDRGREPGILTGESRRVVAMARTISYVGYEMIFQHKIMIQ